MQALSASREWEIGEERILSLVAPPWKHLDTLIVSRDPFVLWPVGDRSLLEHWLQFAKDKGATQVHLYTESPRKIRTFLAKHNISLRLRILSSHPGLLNRSVYVMSRLPYLKAPDSMPQKGLIKYWYQLNEQWLQREHSSGNLQNCAFWWDYWGRIRFCDPIWIEKDVRIEHHVTVGPNVRIGRGSCIGQGTRLSNVLIAPNTYIPPKTVLHNCVHDGKECLPFDDSTVTFQKPKRSPFVQHSVPIIDRIVASGCFCVAKTLGLFFKKHPTVSFYIPHKTLKGAQNGLLLTMRQDWFLEVVRGHMHLFGSLPELTPAAVDHYRQYGAFSYADLHNLHLANAPTKKCAQYEQFLPKNHLRAFLWLHFIELLWKGR
ncbi:MAG TPA: hypothetical protein DHV51_05395 [Opitutae bacterium]|nr:hypothetical protein [Opitutae bacterium]